MYVGDKTLVLLEYEMNMTLNISHVVYVSQCLQPIHCLAATSVPGALFVM